MSASAAYQRLTTQLKPTDVILHPHTDTLHVTFSQYTFDEFTVDKKKRSPFPLTFTRTGGSHGNALSPLCPVDERTLATVYHPSNNTYVSVAKRDDQTVVLVSDTEQGHVAMHEWKTGIPCGATDKEKEKIPLQAPLTDSWFGGLVLEGTSLLGVASAKWVEGAENWEGYTQRQSWGEGYANKDGGVIQPRPFVLDTSTGTVTVYGTGESSYGQAIFVGPRQIVCTRWSTEEKLGLIYCHQRRSELVLIHLDTGNETVLTGGDALDFSCRSPVRVPGCVPGIPGPAGEAKEGTEGAADETVEILYAEEERREESASVCCCARCARCGFVRGVCGVCCVCYVLHAACCVCGAAY